VADAERSVIDRLAEITANIDGHIEAKATEIAAARITAAEEKVTSLMARHAAEVQRLEDLIAELRRQQKAFDKHLEEDCPVVKERRERIRAVNAGGVISRG
jgi:hypothetical protein